MKKCTVSPDARNDLQEIRRHIAKEKHRPRAAARLVQRFRTTFRLLQRFPELGPLREDIAKGLRFFTVGSYVIYYDIMPDKIVILRILHGGRNASRHLEPDDE